MISVRHVKNSDHERFIQFNRTLFNGHYFEPTGTLQYRLKRTLDNANNLKRIQHYDLFVAYVDGRLAGYCVFMPRTNGVEFYVDPSYRREGVGTKLVEAVRKITKLATLCAQTGFPGSEHFFRKHHIYVDGNSVNRMVEIAMREIEPNAFRHDSPVDYITLRRKAVRRVKLRLHHNLRRATVNANC